MESKSFEVKKGERKSLKQKIVVRADEKVKHCCKHAAFATDNAVSLSLSNSPSLSFSSSLSPTHTHTLFYSLSLSFFLSLNHTLSLSCIKGTRRIIFCVSRKAAAALAMAADPAQKILKTFVGTPATEHAHTHLIYSRYRIAPP